MSLRDRLTRRNGGAPVKPAVPVPVPAAEPRQTLTPRGSVPTVTSGMYGRRIEDEVLSGVVVAAAGRVHDRTPPAVGAAAS